MKQNSWSIVVIFNIRLFKYSIPKENLAALYGVSSNLHHNF